MVHKLSRTKRWTAKAVTMAMIAVTASVAITAPVAAVNPPAGGTIVFEETFESATPLQGITTFAGVAGGYTADPFWASNSNCNGILLSADTAGAFGGCSATNVTKLGQIATALGGGDTSNVVVAGYTAGSGTAADLVQVQSNLFPVVDDRFYYASVDVGAQNCFSRSPQHQFFLEDGSGTQTILGAAVEVCDGWDGVRSSITIDTMTSPAAVRWTGGTSLSLGVNNLQPNGGGNDAAIDNLRLIDVTPSLFKDFAPTPIVNGESTNIVLTVVNTDELLAKLGISFTDSMVGLEVVDGVIGGTCSGVTGTAAGSVIDITNVDLLDGEASCTIEVEVVPTDGVGTYENGVDEVSGLSFINPPNDAFLEVLPAPPVVEDHVDSGNTVGDDVVIDVLANATDLEGDIDPTSVAIDDPNYDPATGTLSVPGEGTWTVDPVTGAITFEPEPGFVGDPTPIGYTVMDDAGNTSEPAMITIDYAPEAEDDEDLGNVPGTPVVVDVLANDGDIDPTTVAIDDPNYDPATGTLDVPGEGTWTVDAVTGAITFTPEPGFEGDPTPISYTASDDDGNEVSADVTVGYIPTVEPQESLGNTPGDAVSLDPFAGASPDVDPNTFAFIGLDGVPLAPGAPLEIPGEGVWTYDPSTGLATFTPEPGFEGDPMPVDFTAMDADGNSVEAPGTLTVDYAPSAVDDEDLGNVPGTPVVVDVLANDGDIDPTSVAIDDPNYDPATGTLDVPGEGTWTVDPVTGAITFTPEPGFEGNPTPISYIAEDNDGNAVGADVVVGYTPVAEPDENLDNTPGTPVVVDVFGNDSSSNLDPTSVAIDDPNYDPATGTLDVPGEGTWTVDPVTGAITFTPEPGFVGDPTPIAYTVMDDLGQTTPPVSVVVDYLPGLSPDESLNNAPGTAVDVPLFGNDADDIDPASIAFIGPDGVPLVPGAPLEIPGEGTWTVDPATGIATFTPEPGFLGDPTPVGYTASDFDGTPAETPAFITVTYEDPEVLVAVDDELLDQVAGSTVTLNLLGDDSSSLDPSTLMLLDAEGNPTDTLTVAGEGVWTVNADGSVTFDPEDGFTGDPTPVDYTVSDVLGQSVTAKATITYADPVSSAPVTLALTGVESYQLFLAALLAIGAGMGMTNLANNAAVARKEED